MLHNLPIAIIGAGPVGLAAAAHLLARGETPVVFEAGDAVAQSLRAWAHVRMFSPWGFNVDQAAAALLAAAGWTAPTEGDAPDRWRARRAVSRTARLTPRDAATHSRQDARHGGHA